MLKKNKLSILLIIGVVVITILIIYLKLKPQTRVDIPRIMVSFPSDLKNINYLSSDLLDLFTDETGITYNVLIRESKLYLDGLNDHLKKNYEGDLYYVVNSRTISDPSIFNSLYDFEVKNNSFKKLSDIFKTFHSSGEHFTYVPVTWSPWGIYYNKKVFADLDLKEPKTFDDLVTLSNVLIEHDIVPFSMVQGQKWPLTSWFDYISIRLNGADFHRQLLSGAIDFSSDEVKNVFNMLFDFMESGWFNVDSSSDWTNMVSTLVDGKTAMCLSSTFFYDEISVDNRYNIGWLPFPVVKKGRYDEIVTSSGFITSNVSVNIEGVNEFFKYILSNNGQQLIQDSTDYNSLNRNVIKKTDRVDLINGYNNLSKSRKLLPSLERNTHPKIIIPLKFTLNKMFYLESDENIGLLLESLENIRKDLE